MDLTFSIPLLGSVKRKYGVLAVFVVLAFFDLGSFTLFHLMRDGYSNQEVNLLYRLFGYWPMFLFYVIGHGLLIYAYLRPWYTSRYAGATMAIAIVMVCAIHVIGGLSNIYGYYNPPADNSPITNEELLGISVVLALFNGMLVLMLEGAFIVYFDLADEHNLRQVNENDFVTLAKYPRLAHIWYVFDSSVALVLFVGIMGVIGVVMGRVANLLLLSHPFDWRIAFGLIGVIAGIRAWANNIIKKRKNSIEEHGGGYDA